MKVLHQRKEKDSMKQRGRILISRCDLPSQLYEKVITSSISTELHYFKAQNDTKEKKSQHTNEDDSSLSHQSLNRQTQHVRQEKQQTTTENEDAENVMSLRKCDNTPVVW
jgi:hypothetical protein